ncbi:DMT family transporter, partial [Thermococcus sp.]
MKREALGTLLAAAGALLYGLEPVVIKANPSNPISFAAFSALCASIILWLFLTASSQWREIRERPSHLKKAFLMGLFGTALAYISYSYGARLSTAINASLITRSEVLFSFLLSWIFLGERITKRLISYALIILSGLVLVITQGKLIEPHPGDLLLLLVPLFWQSGHVIAKRLPYSPYTIATLRNTFGFLILLPLAILTGPEFPKLAIAEGIIIALGQVI